MNRSGSRSALRSKKKNKPLLLPSLDDGLRISRLHMKMQEEEERREKEERQRKQRAGQQRLAKILSENEQKWTVVALEKQDKERRLRIFEGRKDLMEENRKKRVAERRAQRDIKLLEKQEKEEKEFFELERQISEIEERKRKREEARARKTQEYLGLYVCTFVCLRL
jgi:hypothetical protein